MTAQPEQPAQRPGLRPVPAIPHTINATDDALRGADRARCCSQVPTTGEAEITGVMRRWWKAAMPNRAPRVRR